MAGRREPSTSPIALKTGTEPGIGHNGGPPLLPLLAEFYTPAQLAAELHITERTLARWHTARYGPPQTRIGRMVLYRRGPAQAWLLEHESAEPVPLPGRRRGRPPASTTRAPKVPPASPPAKPRRTRRTDARAPSGIPSP
jgi:hypothetical protein